MNHHVRPEANSNSKQDFGSVNFTWLRVRQFIGDMELLHCRRIVCNCVSNSGALLTYNTVHSPYISLFLRISEKRTGISAGTHVLLRKVL